MGRCGKWASSGRKAIVPHWGVGNGLPDWLCRIDGNRPNGQDAAHEAPSETPGAPDGPLGSLAWARANSARATALCGAGLAGLRAAAMPFAARPVDAGRRGSVGLGMIRLTPGVQSVQVRYLELVDYFPLCAKHSIQCFGQFAQL